MGKAAYYNRINNCKGGKLIMYDVIEKENVEIKNLIYEINGIQFMFDSDLAKLFEVETKRINEAVKNNPDKFPQKYSWVLNNDEWNFLRSKFSTLENQQSDT